MITETASGPEEARETSIEMVKRAKRFLLVADMGNANWEIGQFDLSNIELMGVAQIAIDAALIAGKRARSLHDN